MSEAEGSARAGRPAWTVGRIGFRWHAAAAALVVVALQLTRGPASAFLYDAAQYWAAPLALLTGGDVTTAGALTMRGVLSSVVYLPPAAATSILGPQTAGWTVLAWNALLAAFLCVGVLPRLAHQVRPGPPIPRIWLSALLGGLLLSGFAPYPLLDVWSLMWALVGVAVLATSRTWWGTGLGALAAAIAVNLRPSYLAPVLLVLVVVIVARPRRLAPAALGAVLAVLPQVLFNLRLAGTPDLLPIATAALTRIQSAQSSYTVRYDTVLTGDRHPQQFFCDPSYAARLVGEAPATSPGEVLTSAAGHLPASLQLFAEKAAASLRWSWSTPYELSPGVGSPLLGLLVTVVAAVGAVAMVRIAVLAWSDAEHRTSALALAAVWIGALGTLVLSTPETRFALPLVAIGLVGTIAAAPFDRRFIGSPRVIVALTSAAVALTIALVLLASLGLASPVTPGPLADVQACADLR